MVTDCQEVSRCRTTDVSSESIVHMSRRHQQQMENIDTTDLQWELPWVEGYLP